MGTVHIMNLKTFKNYFSKEKHLLVTPVYMAGLLVMSFVWLATLWVLQLFVDLDLCCFQSLGQDLSLSVLLNQSLKYNTRKVFSYVLENIFRPLTGIHRTPMTPIYTVSMCGVSYTCRLNM